MAKESRGLLFLAQNLGDPSAVIKEQLRRKTDQPRKRDSQKDWGREQMVSKHPDSGGDKSVEEKEGWRHKGKQNRESYRSGESDSSPLLREHIFSPLSGYISSLGYLHLGPTLMAPAVP